VKPDGRYDHVAYVSELRSLVQALGVAQRVSFLGERTDVLRLVGDMDLILVPSWEEPFGRVIIEAMAAGTPVVATDVGGPVEIIRSGYDGLLLPPRAIEVWARHLESLLADSASRDRFAMRGRLHIQESFTSHRHAEQIVDVYRGVLRS
jgi:glycosyltransferase involved in cell wall biosynthesis